MIHRFTQATPNDRFISQDAATTRTDVEQRYSPLQLHDPESRDLVLANKLAQEIINISGSEVVVYTRTPNEGYDKTWEEDADPTYMAGKRVKAFFAPKPLDLQLRPWGVEVENQTDVYFCRDEVYRLFGARMIVEGDIVELPYNAAVKQVGRYRVLNACDSGNFKYHWLYYQCKVENITNDRSIDIVHK